MSLLTLAGLCFGHGQPLARPLSLSLAAGEQAVLLGPNGVGKSTLLQAVLDPALRLGGEVRLAPGARVGYLAQSGEALDGLPLNGRELLALTGALHEGLSEPLRDCLPRRLDALSGGQRQFLRFWSIAAAPFDVLLLDEPSNNLDEAGVAALQHWLAQPHSAQAVLLVTHDTRLVAARQHRLRLEPA
ncbi:MAG: ABC-F family ATP-binding cassette domain-containing protein [Rhodocyclaceae bacterium]|nr:ABC-F family ATP-binding cassette domain-containing protein [Rhodocyclaceae bacterium]